MAVSKNISLSPSLSQAEESNFEDDSLASETRTAGRRLRRDAQLNRDRIIAVAHDLFAMGGIDIALEEIARQANVGIGTVYRHFPTRENLIDAVFEQSIVEFIEAAKIALTKPTGWDGFTFYLERALAIHVANRGVKDVVATDAPGREKVHAMRLQMKPLVVEIITRAQAEGSLRPDFTYEDIPIVFWTGARVIDATAEFAPKFYRRFLGIILDGLRAETATPLPHSPLTRKQLNQIMERRLEKQQRTNKTEDRNVRK